jgi:hypothetical protein
MALLPVSSKDNLSSLNSLILTRYQIPLSVPLCLCGLFYFLSLFRSNIEREIPPIFLWYLPNPDAPLRKKVVGLIPNTSHLIFHP